MSLFTTSSDAQTPKLELQQKKDHPAPTGAGAPTPLVDGSLNAARKCLEHGDYQKCLKLLPKDIRTPDVINLTAVCLLRLNRAADALKYLRPLTLVSGGAWVNRDLPQSTQHNLATALLMTGHPAGCVEVLSDLKDKRHPYALQLRAAIQKWAQSLRFWDRLNWKMGKIEPNQCQVPIDFQVGDL